MFPSFRSDTKERVRAISRACVLLCVQSDRHGTAACLELCLAASMPRMRTTFALCLPFQLFHGLPIPSTVHEPHAKLGTPARSVPGPMGGGHAGSAPMGIRSRTEAGPGGILRNMSRGRGRSAVLGRSARGIGRIRTVIPLVTYSWLRSRLSLEAGLRSMIAH